MKLMYFQINYYREYDAAGFPVGKPIQTHAISAPFFAVAQDDVPGISLGKAATFARTLGYVGRFGIEELTKFVSAAE